MRVARDTGRSLAAVAGDPYALTLYTWGHLVAQERRDRLVRQGSDLALATDFAIAVNKPERLKDRFIQFEDDLGLRESAEDAMSKGIDLMAKLRLVEEANAVARAQAAKETKP